MSNSVPFYKEFGIIYSLSISESRELREFFELLSNNYGICYLSTIYSDIG